MERFSNTKKITKENLVGVPNDQPGVYRIKDAKGEILYIGKAKRGGLDHGIWTHRGRFQKNTQFQYRTVESAEAVERLRREELRKHVPPFRRIT